MKNKFIKKYIFIMHKNWKKGYFYSRSFFIKMIFSNIVSGVICEYKQYFQMHFVHKVINKKSYKKRRIFLFFREYLNI